MGRSTLLLSGSESSHTTPHSSWVWSYCQPSGVVAYNTRFLAVMTFTETTKQQTRMCCAEVMVVSSSRQKTSKDVICPRRRKRENYCNSWWWDTQRVTGRLPVARKQNYVTCGKVWGEYLQWIHIFFFVFCITADTCKSSSKRILGCLTRGLQCKHVTCEWIVMPDQCSSYRILCTTADAFNSCMFNGGQHFKKFPPQPEFLLSGDTKGQLMCLYALDL